MKVYIAGPMRGYPEHNFPAFFAAEREWQRAGWEVVNPARWDTEGGVPAEPGEPGGWTFEDFMARDLALLVYCDAIAMLPGWQDSRGANVEHAVATAMGKKVYLNGSRAARHPVTDHPHRSGGFNAGVVQECCDLPDYMHMPLWANS